MVKRKPIFGPPAPTPGEFYFVRFEEGAPDENMRGQILRSTDYSHGYAYLLNARPGRYAVIGFKAGFKGSPRVLFNRSLITRLTRSINPGTAGLLGDILIESEGIRNETQLDEVQQQNFKELMMGKDVREVVENYRFLGHQFPIGGWQGASLSEEYPLESASRQFLTVLSQNLPKAWEPWIRNSVVPAA